MSGIIANETRRAFLNRCRSNSERTLMLPELRMAERLMRTDSEMIGIINIDDRSTIQNKAQSRPTR